MAANSSMAIDEVGFFGRELSAAEIAWLAGEPQGPVDLTDDFSLGMNANLWVREGNDPLYSFSDTHGEIRLSRPTGGSYQFNYSGLQFDREVWGDFDVSVEFREARINRVDGAPGNQVQLNLQLGGQTLCVVRSDEASLGHNAHVWRDPPADLTPSMPTSATNGTLRLTRVGAAVTAYLNDTVLHAGVYNTNPVTWLALTLQNNRTRDATSVVFDDFHLRADRLMPKPAQLQALGAAGNQFQLRLLNPTPGAWHWVERTALLPPTNGWTMVDRLTGGAFPTNWQHALPSGETTGFYRVRSQ
jgi:hypothetical protein